MGDLGPTPVPVQTPPSVRLLTCRLCQRVGPDLRGEADAVVHGEIRWRDPQPGHWFGSGPMCVDRRTCRERCEAADNPWALDDGTPPTRLRWDHPLNGLVSPLLAVFGRPPADAATPDSAGRPIAPRRATPAPSAPVSADPPQEAHHGAPGDTTAHQPAPAASAIASGDELDWSAGL